MIVISERRFPQGQIAQDVVAGFLGQNSSVNLETPQLQGSQNLFAGWFEAKAVLNPQMESLCFTLAVSVNIIIQECTEIPQIENDALVFAELKHYTILLSIFTFVQHFAGNMKKLHKDEKDYFSLCSFCSNKLYFEDILHKDEINEANLCNRAGAPGSLLFHR